MQPGGMVPQVPMAETAALVAAAVVVIGITMILEQAAQAVLTEAMVPGEVGQDLRDQVAQDKEPPQENSENQVELYMLEAAEVMANNTQALAEMAEEEQGLLEALAV